MKNSKNEGEKYEDDSSSEGNGMGDETETT